MPAHKRDVRVAGEIHAVLADLLRRELKDPRVTPISITAVRLSGDLGVAWVRFVPLGGEGDPKAILQGLKAASGFLRHQIGLRLRLRTTPQLVFELDAGLDRSIELTSLLSRLEEEESAAREGRNEEEEP